MHIMSWTHSLCVSCTIVDDDDGDDDDYDANIVYMKCVYIYIQ